MPRAGDGGGGESSARVRGASEPRARRPVAAAPPSLRALFLCRRPPPFVLLSLASDNVSFHSAPFPARSLPPPPTSPLVHPSSPTRLAHARMPPTRPLLAPCARSHAPCSRRSRVLAPCAPFVSSRGACLPFPRPALGPTARVLTEPFFPPPRDSHAGSPATTMQRTEIEREESRGGARRGGSRLKRARPAWGGRARLEPRGAWRWFGGEKGGVEPRARAR